MKLFIVSFCALFSVLFSQAQQEFVANGKVIDASTKQPLAGASVFCQNTTFGTITNSEGNFKLALPNGGYDLIISFTGYETQDMRISVTNAADLTIELKLKDKSMAEVTVAGSNEVPDGLVKYGSFFLENFIGNTANGAQTKIENPEVLQFYYSKKRNRLKIKAKEDLVIVNNALGYKIKYQLDSFAYEYGTDITTYSGYPFFEEMQGTDAQKEQWKENRKKAYLGSRLHFIRSWYDTSLTKEGFVLETVDPNSKTLKTEPLQNPYDTSIYHLVEDNDVEILFNGKLRVSYRNELPDPKYLAKYKMASYIKAQVTILDITEGFIIQRNGYFYEQNDVTNTGYWTWEKMADALPYDYKLE